MFHLPLLPLKRLSGFFLPSNACSFLLFRDSLFFIPPLPQFGCQHLFNGYRTRWAARLLQHLPFSPLFKGVDKLLSAKLRDFLFFPHHPLVMDHPCWGATKNALQISGSSDRSDEGQFGGCYDVWKKVGGNDLHFDEITTATGCPSGEGGRRHAIYWNGRSIACERSSYSLRFFHTSDSFSTTEKACPFPGWSDPSK